MSAPIWDCAELEFDDDPRPCPHRWAQKGCLIVCRWCGLLRRGRV